MTDPAAPPEGTISCEQRGHLYLIGINRPAKLNGFTPRMYAELAQAVSVQQELASSEDAAEGLRSFVERRAAKFAGR